MVCWRGAWVDGWVGGSFDASTESFSIVPPMVWFRMVPKEEVMAAAMALVTRLFLEIRNCC
jgi:hypothetical protein